MEDFNDPPKDILQKEDKSQHASHEDNFSPKIESNKIKDADSSLYKFVK